MSHENVNKKTRVVDTKVGLQTRDLFSGQHLPSHLLSLQFLLLLNQENKRVTRMREKGTKITCKKEIMEKKSGMKVNFS